MSLVDQDGVLVELPSSAAQALAADGALKGAFPDQNAAMNPKVAELLSKASTEDLEVANVRCRIVRDHLGNRLRGEPESAPARTVRRWVASYRMAEHHCGSGYLGLLPRSRNRDNQTERLPEKSRQLLKEFIERDYENLKQKTMYASWIGLKHECEARNILAPSYRTFTIKVHQKAGLIRRECVRRHGRLPQIIVLDGGHEFDSVYFETLLARYECTKKTRPPAKPRFGSVCERMFGTANTHFVHNLLGNTQVTRNVRQVTKSNNPERHATWTLPELSDRLAQYFYEVYDTITHPALGQSPREAYEQGLAATGTRPQKQIAYDLEFHIWTLPTTAKGTAKISPGRGVKINHVYYWSEALRDPAVERREVPVRYDPFDIGTAYAFAGDHWVRCVSEHYLVLRGRTEKELALASTEPRRRNQCHSRTFEVTASKLARFLASVESEEVLLLQRLRDLENGAMRERLFGVNHRDGDLCTTNPPLTAEAVAKPEAAAETYEIYGEF